MFSLKKQYEKKKESAVKIFEKKKSLAFPREKVTAETIEGKCKKLFKSSHDF